MMRERMWWCVLAAVLMIGRPAAAAGEHSAGKSLIEEMGKDGKALVAGTATSGGNPSTLVGNDTPAEPPPAKRVDEDPRTPPGGHGADPWDPGRMEVQAISSHDVECTSGAKRGYVYTIQDGDGQGSCESTIDGRNTSGGTCTKDGLVCASVDCNYGCLNVNRGCQCSVKSKPKGAISIEED